MQLLAKFKKILYMGFRATLNSRSVSSSGLNISKRIQLLSLIFPMPFGY